MAAGGLASVLRACSAAATLLVPNSIPTAPLQDGPSATVLSSGGSNFSKSARPNWHPSGSVSSEHKASSTVLFHTREVYNFDNPFKTGSPRGEPQ